MDILLIYLAINVLLAFISFFLHKKRLNYLLFIPFIGMQIFLNIYLANHLNETLHVYFKVDPIGLIFLTVLTIISVPTIIHTGIYSYKSKEGARISSLHNSALMLFIVMMTGVLITEHIGLMWAFLEATTLCAAILIYHERSTAALEATWKYVFVCSIGIALAFVGILFLGIASQDAESLDFSYKALTQAAPSMDSNWLKLCFLFIITGFSVKMGVTPLFNVDIDAKDMAPSPIGAIFSGGLLNVGFVAIFRFYQIFAHTSIFSWMNHVLMIVGVVSIFFAAVYLLKVRNYKRVFAYSSLEHAGIALLAISVGGIGYFAAILHLILHAFAKSSLFFQIGQVYHTFKNLSINKIGDYFKINPYGGVVLVLGFLCITAMPPSGLFLTEFLTFKALIDKDHLLVAIGVLILLSFIIYALAKKFLQLLFAGERHLADFTCTATHPMETITQYILLTAVIVVGIYPPAFLTDFIHLAVQNLPR